LQWRDLDIANKTLRIERAVEKVKKQPLTLKEPKRAAHKRTIAIDDDLVALLVAEREKALRIQAGVPEGAQVDLSLVKLPEGALMFPNMPAAGEDFSFTSLRDPDSSTKELTRRARKLGFAGLRPFHDLRGSHETALLDRGVAVHVVAARCGHDPAVLLRSYAKRTRKADTSAAKVIERCRKGCSDSLGSKLGPGCQSVAISFTFPMTKNAVVTKEGRVAEWFKAAVLKTISGGHP
jgi:integrase